MNDLADANPVQTASEGSESHGWLPPAFQVISLDCEITAYAPDGGDEPPLF